MSGKTREQWQQELAAARRRIAELESLLADTPGHPVSAHPQQNFLVNIAQQTIAQEQAFRQNAVLAGIARIFRETLTCRTEEELGQVCLAVAAEITQSAFGFVGEINPLTGKLDDIAISDPGWDACRIIDRPGHGTRAPVGLQVHGIYGRVLTDGKAFFTNDPSSHPDAIGTPPGHPPLKAFLGVPLIHAGHTMGMIGLGNREGGYGPEQLEAAEALAPAVVQAFLSKRSEEALRESESFHRQTLESIPGMVFTTRPDGYCDYQSQQWVEFTGIPISEHLGDGWNKLLHPDDRPRAYAAWRAAVEDRAPYDLEYRVRRHDGQYEWFKVIGRPIRDASGHIVRWFGVAANINDLKRAEQQLKALNETLEHRVAERTAEAEQRTAQLRALTAQLTRAEQQERQRLATILHDHLQQLLVGAKFSLGILRSQLGEPHQRQSLRDLDDVLDQSLDASRSLTVDLCPPILHKGSMAQVLRWLAEWVNTRHGLAVEVNADERANPQAQEVRALLFQAVRELLFNVVKHAGVQKAAVKLCRTTAGRVKIIVSDAGRGFDPDHSGKPRHEGSGFGLFSIRERLDWLGGRLDIESTPTQGTVATILAPMQIRSQTPEPIEISPLASPLSNVTTSATAQVPPTRVRVLLADDHAVMRDGLARLLQLQPWIEVVGQAADGCQAVELAAQLRPDVIVMDITMPHMDGIEATRRIVALRPGVKIIGLSMFSEPGVTEAMKTAGATSYLSKTSGPDALLAAIRDCVLTSSDLVV